MQLPKNYTPNDYEDNIYALWEKSGAFQPKNRGNDETFSIVVPPPNANGNLHIGHGLNLVLMDTLVRYNRMQGKAALFIPGADHAGFETQAVYEKQLAKQGKSRFDFNREELYSQIWDFVDLNKTNYESQFRRLGASVDWGHYTYTLDNKIVNQAYSTFKKMWDEGLIYRGERLVNYCTQHRTGFADIEVEHEDAVTPLYYMKYGPFTVATTRPETKFGDTAVAVHPEDKRYAKYVGQVITVEGVNGPFEIQVLADEMVDIEFGTGVVKITPAHDQNDWEVAKRHNLSAKRVINHDGTMNEHAGPFRGMTVLEARKAVAKKMEEMGLMVKVDTKYKNRVGKCYKCGTVIEPMLLDQWFVDMKPLADKAIEALKSNKIEFHPDAKREQLIDYLEGLYDWNISRQIAWGIPIPAFQNVNDSDDWIFDTNVDQEIIEKDGNKYRRDPDVFDTWFSSSSWPYATVDFPDGEDFKNFYPNSVMETGADILYPWVSRMIMFGLYNTGEVPFKDVYLHGLIQDEHGAKMSKSKGNVVNPMDLIDEFGSDGFRFGIVLDESAGVNRPYDPSKLVGARNFCNKLWNVARFVEDKIGEEYHLKNELVLKTPADEWMLTRLNDATDTISRQVEKYKFAGAYNSVYHLLWDDFADWYIESSKVDLNKGMLAYSLETILKLAHPFAPFVTETIWQTLKWENETMLAISSWPVKQDSKGVNSSDFETIKELVIEIRNIRTTADLGKPALLYAPSELLTGNKDLVVKLAKLGGAAEVQEGEGLKLSHSSFNAWLDVDESTKKRICEQLANRLITEEDSIKQLEGRLKNKSYVENAPEKLVTETRDKLDLAKSTAQNIKEQIEIFS